MHGFLCSCSIGWVPRDQSLGSFCQKNIFGIVIRKFEKCKISSLEAIFPNKSENKILCTKFSFLITMYINTLKAYTKEIHNFTRLFTY